MMKNAGFTLVELMIGMAISLIIMAGAVYVFVNITQVSLYEIRSARAMDQARDVMQLMARDIRRAGYQGHQARRDDPDGVNVHDLDQASLNLIPGMENVATHSYIQVLESNTCVLYSYNLDDSWVEGSQDVINYDEFFGFKLESGVLKTLMDASSVNAGDEFGCTTGTWGSITHEDVFDVTGLKFTLSESCIDADTELACDVSPVSPVYILKVTIELKGNAKASGSNQATFSLSETVDLPNLRMFSQS